MERLSRLNELEILNIQIELLDVLIESYKQEEQQFELTSAFLLDQKIYYLEKFRKTSNQLEVERANERR